LSRILAFVTTRLQFCGNSIAALSTDALENRSSESHQLESILVDRAMARPRIAVDGK
jgi:hypothetical protein